MIEAGFAGRLRTAAASTPEKDFLRFRDADSSSFAAFDLYVDGLAAGLQAKGVGRGDVVVVMLPNCREFVGVWLALARLGAVTAAVNTAFKGPGLRHALDLAGARLIVVDEEFVPALAAVADEVQGLEVAAVRGDVDQARNLLDLAEVLAFGSLEGDAVTLTEPPSIEPGNLLMLLYTSGTTGRSKACAITHGYALTQASLFARHIGLHADDVFYCPFPLFHGDGAMYTIGPALELGATAALAPKFSVRGFWDDIRDLGATTFDFMGATLTFLAKAPAAPPDAENPARLGWGIPLPEWAADFEARFDVELTTAYGLTETGVCVFAPRGESLPPGSAGKPVAPYELMIVDKDQRAVAPGSTGEILVRAAGDHVLCDGYFGMPEETAAVFGPEWVRTGDLGAIDENGWFFFRGRKKDALRRRGQNISAFEVQEVLDSHPAVLESAVCGVQSEVTEQEVIAFVVPRPGAKVDPAELVAFGAERMAAFMVPRYVEILDQLPKTKTEKVAKHELEARGVSVSTWDREAADA